MKHHAFLFLQEPPLFAEEIKNKAKELFEQKEGYNCGFTELEWRIAASHFLHIPALDNLNSLIERISKVAQVAIVISSDWREDGSVQDIKEQMFAIHSFSQFIIDKTPDRITHNLNEKKYGFDLQDRGNQIEYWITENRKRWNVANFVVIDDCDEGISKRFPDNFVKVERLFSNEEAEQAYNILSTSSQYSNT